MRMSALWVATVAAVLLLPAPRAQEPALETDEDKTLYTLGLAISQNLAALDFSASELALIQAGITDGVLGRDERVDPETFGPKVQPMLQARAQAVTDRKAGSPSVCSLRLFRFFRFRVTILRLSRSSSSDHAEIALTTAACNSASMLARDVSTTSASWSALPNRSR